MNPLFRQRLRKRLDVLLFYGLLAAIVGLLGWLSTRYQAQWDWTLGSRNSLTEVSRQVILALDKPLHVTAFASETPLLRKQISELVGRYQRVRPDIALQFINPDTQPTRVRDLGIITDGQLLLDYDGRSETVSERTEASLTHAIERLAQRDELWIVAIRGHGERNLEGEANHDLGTLGQALKGKGFFLQPLALANIPLIPENTSVLFIAGPRTDYLPGELEAIRQYIDRGGNLLWLSDPGDSPSLQTIAEHIGLRFLPGVVVDASSELLGVDNPAVVLVTDYPEHPVTRGLQVLSLYPQAVAIEPVPGDQWAVTDLLVTSDRTWNETGPIEGTIRQEPDKAEQAGPLNIGLALTRQRIEVPGNDTPGEQRILVIGDGDFLSNAFLGNGGNLDLGIGMLRWLAGEDHLLDIPARNAPDRDLQLSPASGAVIGLGLLVVLPLGLVVTGLVIGWRRRRR